MNRSRIYLDGMARLWYVEHRKKEFNPKCTVRTLKYGVGSVKVCGCFAWNGVGNFVFVEDHTTGEMYNDILPEKLCVPSKKLQLGMDILFQHDNDPKHTSRVVKN